MSKGIYNRFLSMTKRQLGINGLGETLEVVREVSGAFNPATGEVEGGGLEILSTTGVRLNIKQYLINNETILDSDVLLYVHPEDIDGNVIDNINVTDKIVFCGETYLVVDNKPWNFNGVTIGYKVHCRVSS